jgi:hypothetical protein
METAFTGLIVITLLLVAVLTVSQSFLATQNGVLTSWQHMEDRLGERARTDLSPVRSETSADGSTVDLTVRNDGDTKLSDFDRWDVIVQYHDAGGGFIQQWLAYSEFGSPNKWTIDFSKGTTETYEPRILNPGEEMVIELALEPVVAMTTTNRITIATPNGVNTSAVFTH